MLNLLSSFFFFFLTHSLNHLHTFFIFKNICCFTPFRTSHVLVIVGIQQIECIAILFNYRKHLLAVRFILRPFHNQFFIRFIILPFLHIKSRQFNDIFTSLPALRSFCFFHTKNDIPYTVQFFSIFSINIPYPLVGSFTRTCVTAPTSFPS